MKIAVIGAGPGGLAVSLLLLEAGFDVSLYEKDNVVGGRSQRLSLGAYHFDTGPTFLMYIEVLKKVFERIGENLEHVIKITALDPLYSLYTDHYQLTIRKDLSANSKSIDALFPGSGAAYLQFLHDEEPRFNALDPIMTLPFKHPLNLLRKSILKARKYINPKKSIDDRLKHYFKHEELRTMLSFQSKYLGMAPQEAPAFFTMLTYLEHVKGLYHVEGGLNQIHEAMKGLFIKKGGQLYLGTEIKKIHTHKRRVTKLTLADDSERFYDLVVSNIDVSHMINAVLETEASYTYTQETLKNMAYSLSTYNLYLGINRELPLEHHTFIFPKNYAENAKKITKDYQLPDDYMFYLHAPSKLDSTLAPKGHSSLYVLVPVPNNRSNIDWETEGENLRNLIIKTLESRFNIDNLEDSIVEEKSITPMDWEKDFNVYLGAVFNLSHRLNQMLYKRPQNAYNDVKNLYLVGGGTHPGSGLPTIYQSAIVTADLIIKKYKK